MESNKINEAALTKRIKTLVLQERYEDALKVLDDIEISKIRNISILCLVGEVYMGLGRYDEAEHVLLRVYEKSPNTRRILDLLTTLYIDKGEYSEAEYYYKEFIGVASRDLHRYILRYRLDKGKGERLSVLIDTLEKLKDYEYIEEWAYELASLYDASGEKQKCIRECDEIALWFGHGEYVDKAIALKCKLTGEPLPEMTTVEMHQAEEKKIAAENAALANMLSDQVDEYLGEQYENSIDLGLIEKALNSAEKNEEANSADNTPSATEKGEAESEKSVDAEKAEKAEAVEIEDPEEVETAEPAEVEDAEEVEAAEVEDAEEAEPSETAENEDADEADEMDETVDEQILQEAIDEREEKDDKSHIAKLFNSLMFGKSRQKETVETEARQSENAVPEFSEVDDILQQLMAEKAAEEENDKDLADDDLMDIESEPEETDVAETTEPEEETDAAETTEPEEEAEAAETTEPTEDADAAKTTEPEEEAEAAETSEPTEETDADSAESGEAVDGDDEDDDDEDEIIDETEQPIDLFFGEEMHTDRTEAEAAETVETVEDDEDDEDEISDAIQASDTVMNIFASVAGVKSIQNQLAKTFTKFEDPALDSMDLLAPYDINFVVTGDDMSVKSQIAIGIAKALNTYGVCDKNKLVRATADDLNGRDFTMIFDKLKGGCLIVEGADRLNDQSASIIASFVQKDDQDVAIVLEGVEARIQELFGKYPVLHSKFLNIIHIGKYNENELVQLAAGYAKKKGYELSKSAEAALKHLLAERMADGYSVNYEDIMAIIEEAIASLEKRNMKNLFMTVLDNKYEEAAMFELQPDDFDNINIPD